MRITGKWIVASMLSLSVLATLIIPAEAGRRTRRAAAIAVVAASAAPRRSTTVVAAPVPVRRRAAVAVAAAPDLTVTKMSADSEALVIVVKNIGRAAAPQTLLRVALRDPVDIALLATHVCRVPALNVNQSVRIVLRSAPLGDVRVTAVVDPDQTVAESNEANNDLAIRAVTSVRPAQPMQLEAEEVWGEPIGAVDGVSESPRAE